MTYRVVIPESVFAAIDEQTEYLREQLAPESRVDGWLNGLYVRIKSLQDWPRRFPIAEAVSRAAGYDVRRMNFGEYAVFYRVEDERREVIVIAFRHGRRRPLEDDPEAP